MKDFESRAREAADKYFDVITDGKNILGNITYSADHPGKLQNNANRRPAFLSGVKWSRKETLREVLELLRRSEEIRPGYLAYGGDWADWLEREMEK